MSHSSALKLGASSRATLLLALGFVFLSWFLPSLLSCAPEKSARSRLVAPHERREMDNEGVRLMQRLSRHASSGLAIEDDRAWETLVLLEPYRVNQEVQSALKDWVEYEVQWSRKLSPLDRSESRTSKKNPLRKAVIEEPLRLDRRVELASQLLEQNLDLAAQVELETAHNLDPSDIATLTYLSVVYKRLGFQTRALQMARLAYDLTRKQQAGSGKGGGSAGSGSAQQSGLAAEFGPLLAEATGGKAGGVLQANVTVERQGYLYTGCAGTYRNPSDRGLPMQWLVVFLVVSLLMFIILGRTIPEGSPFYFLVPTLPALFFFSTWGVGPNGGGLAVGLVYWAVALRFTMMIQTWFSNRRRRQAETEEREEEEARAAMKEAQRASQEIDTPDAGGTWH